MQIIDISVPIYTGMVFYPGDPGARIEPVLSVAQGDTANLSNLILGSHTGTHVDAPRHFVSGALTVDRIPLETLMGPAHVLDLTSLEGLIAREHLEEAGLDGCERLLLKTSNSRLWPRPEFDRQYVALTPEAADFIVDEGIKLVGIDYLSIEMYKSPDYYVHHKLLGNEVVVLEGIDLSDVAAGDYELACLPLKIMDGDGAPARAVLISER